MSKRAFSNQRLRRKTAGPRRQGGKPPHQRADLQEWQQCFRLFSEMAFDGLAFIEEGVFADCNGEMARMLGCTRAALRGRPVLDFVAPGDRERVAGYLRQGRRAPCRHFALRKDGRSFPVEVRTRTTTVGGGRVQLLAVREVAERKLAEQTLRERTDKLSSILRAAPTGAGVVSNRILKEVNDRICEMTGYAREELLKQNARLLHPSDEDYEFVGREKYRQIRACGTGTVESRWQRKDGRLLDVLLSSTPINPEDWSAGVTFTALDITERKRAEEALRESEERLRLAINAANQGLYDLNVQTGEATVSPEYATMLGYDPATFHETNAAWIERLHPEDRERVVATYRDYVAGKLPVYQVEFRQRTASGGWVWILSLGKLVSRDTAGQPLRMLGTHTDISQRKQAEEELLASRQMLRLVLDTIPTRVFWKDRIYVYIGCNQAFAQDCGYAHPDQLVGKTDDDTAGNPAERTWGGRADPPREACLKWTTELRLRRPCASPSKTPPPRR